MEIKDKKSKILKLYKKQKLIKLLSTKRVLPFAALFLITTGVIGIVLALAFRMYSLGGVFAGLGLSAGIISLTYVLVNGEDDSFVNAVIKSSDIKMEDLSKNNQFKKEMYQKIELAKCNDQHMQQTKKLINELREKLASSQDKVEEKSQFKVCLKEQKLNLIKQRTQAREYLKEAKDYEKEYIRLNKKIKKLNPDLDVDYIGTIANFEEIR